MHNPKESTVSNRVFLIPPLLGSIIMTAAFLLAISSLHRQGDRLLATICVVLGTISLAISVLLTRAIVLNLPPNLVLAEIYNLIGIHKSQKK